MKLVKAIALLISAADEHAFLSPQSVPIRADFLNIEIMLVAALDVFINGYSATSAITCYPGAIWLASLAQTTTTCG